MIGAYSGYAQTGRQEEDSTFRYYARLANSSSEADKSLLENKLYDLLKSAEQRDWTTARRFFFQLKKAAVVDSIEAAEKKKFPEGELMRAEGAQLIHDEKDAAKKEIMYKAWIKKFPPEKSGPDRIQYDYVRNAVSRAFANEEVIDKAVEYADMIETPAWKGEGWASTANVLLKKGHQQEAAALLRKAIDRAYLYTTSLKNDPGAGFAVTGYPGYCVTYAQVLFREEKYEEAVRYFERAHADKTRKRAPGEEYIQALMILGREKEAFAVIDEAVKNGMATKAMKENLRSLYPKVKGTHEGFDEYMASLGKMLAEQTRTHLAKQMINTPAPDFTLNDVDGKTVSLSELKGKTVIVDFWATWCGPCKNSFPSMKSAVLKYKDDPNVQFLFVHTWERNDKNAAQNAKQFIAKNNYPFEVLMDLKDTVSGTNPVVERYNVTGIPTKFVIDKNGNIRFRFTGATAGDDAAVEEVSAMIELSK